MKSERPLAMVFFQTEAGNEPVREWLKSLPREERHTIGEDLLTVQHGWPVHKPLVDNLGGGIWELRSRLPNRLRAPCSSSPKERLWCFTVSLKRRRRRQHRSSAWPGGENANTNIMSKNKHRGSDLRDLLREDGVLEA